jgi:predicted DNA-binding transcriptional regulator AlpA
VSKTKTKTNKSKRRTDALVERTNALKSADVGLRLLSKPEVLAITGTSFPTLWQWMRDGKFPRARIVGGRSMWFSQDIETWLADLKVRPWKGDASSAAA